MPNPPFGVQAALGGRFLDRCPNGTTETPPPKGSKGKNNKIKAADPDE